MAVSDGTLNAELKMRWEIINKFSVVHEFIPEKLLPGTAHLPCRTDDEIMPLLLYPTAYRPGEIIGLPSS
jgi:hypothetical protein